MYMRHFAFTRHPFETPAKSDELFKSQSRSEAEARLKHLIELRGIGLITGQPGSGKTSACRFVADQLHPGQHRTFYVSLTTGSAIDLYRTIGWEFGLETERTRAGASRAIRAEITRLVQTARQVPILFVDEAHLLHNDLFEELRLLTNFDMDSTQRMCLVFIGLTHLRRKLAMAAHESLRQRIVVRHHVGGLVRDELDRYLAHRLRLAGSDVPAFEPEAVEALFQASDGLPRQINRIAHYALSAAAIDGNRMVGAVHVERASAEVSP